VLPAHLFLAVTTVAEHAKPAPLGLIPLSLNEIRHQFAQLVIHRNHNITACLRWSRWRQHHQHRTQQAHNQRQPDRNP
jgi:hypothetical protein